MRSRRGLGQREMALNYRTHFAYRIDMGDADGENITEHLAGVEDLQFAKATSKLPVSAGPGHQSPCAKARESLKTIGGYGLGKERRLRHDDGRQEPDH